MKVWALIFVVKYEAEDLCGIFTTPEKGMESVDNATSEWTKVDRGGNVSYYANHKYGTWELNEWKVDV